MVIGAYWAADEGPVFWVRLATSWDVPTAHNGWIEIALALGFPGVALMALVYLSAVGRALSRLFRGPETYWALSFLGMLGLVSISESNFLQQNSLGWTLFVMTAVKLAERRTQLGCRAVKARLELFQPGDLAGCLYGLVNPQCRLR